MDDNRGSVHLVQAKEREAGVVRPEVGGNFPLDEAVIEVLPPGIKVISAESFGSSAWSITARINGETAEGAPVGFFLKCTTEDSGRAQLEGEYTAMTELRKVLDLMIPEPLAWGKFHLESPPTYFFLADFKNMSDKLPDPVQLGALVAELHQKSVSPEGKFGFGIQTYDGKLPHNVEWNSDWTDFYAKLLTSAYDHDVRSNGPWSELAGTFKTIIHSVIPRLLDALHANGRQIKPCLIHGDLWEGNIGTEYETGQIFIYDSAAYYAHNEMEIASWTCKHHKLRARAYKREYLRHFDASEPVDEWEDRSRLYGLKELLINSAHFPGSNVRERAYEEMSFLIEKYAPSSKTQRAPGAGGDVTPRLPATGEADTAIPAAAEKATEAAAGTKQPDIEIDNTAYSVTTEPFAPLPPDTGLGDTGKDLSGLKIASDEPVPSKPDVEQVVEENQESNSMSAPATDNTSNPAILKAGLESEGTKIEESGSIPVVGPDVNGPAILNPNPEPNVAKPNEPDSNPVTGTDGIETKATSAYVEHPSELAESSR